MNQFQFPSIVGPNPGLAGSLRRYGLEEEERNASVPQQFPTVTYTAYAPSYPSSQEEYQTRTQYNPNQYESTTSTLRVGSSTLLLHTSPHTYNGQPSGTFSSRLPSAAIAHATRQMDELTEQLRRKTKQLEEREFIERKREESNASTIRTFQPPVDPEQVISSEEQELVSSIAKFPLNQLPPHLRTQATELVSSHVERVVYADSVSDEESSEEEEVSEVYSVEILGTNAKCTCNPNQLRYEGGCSSKNCRYFLSLDAQSLSSFKSKESIDSGPVPNLVSMRSKIQTTMRRDFTTNSSEVTKLHAIGKKKKGPPPPPPPPPPPSILSELGINEPTTPMKPIPVVDQGDEVASEHRLNISVNKLDSCNHYGTVQFVQQQLDGQNNSPVLHSSPLRNGVLDFTDSTHIGDGKQGEGKDTESPIADREEVQCGTLREDKRGPSGNLEPLHIQKFDEMSNISGLGSPMQSPLLAMNTPYFQTDFAEFKPSIESDTEDGSNAPATPRNDRSSTNPSSTPSNASTSATTKLPLASASSSSFPSSPTLGGSNAGPVRSKRVKRGAGKPVLSEDVASATISAPSESNATPGVASEPQTPVSQTSETARAFGGYSPPMTPFTPLHFSQLDDSPIVVDPIAGNSAHPSVVSKVANPSNFAAPEEIEVLEVSLFGDDDDEEDDGVKGVPEHAKDRGTPLNSPNYAPQTTHGARRISSLYSDNGTSASNSTTVHSGYEPLRTSTRSLNSSTHSSLYAPSQQDHTPMSREWGSDVSEPPTSLHPHSVPSLPVSPKDFGPPTSPSGLAHPNNGRTNTAHDIPPPMVPPNIVPSPATTATTAPFAAMPHRLSKPPGKEMPLLRTAPGVVEAPPEDRNSVFWESQRRPVHSPQQLTSSRSRAEVLSHGARSAFGAYLSHRH